MTYLFRSARNRAFGLLFLAVGSVLLALAPSARANVYATDVRVNDSTTAIVTNAATSFTISYLLNEPATAGVTVTIKNGATVIRNIDISSGAGTTQGTNSVVWDGKDGQGNAQTSGTLSVSVTARAVGYTNWTQVTSDTDTYAVWAPRGIAINRNTNSPYYGRVYVDNANLGAHPESLPGHNVGILKLNADASIPADGGFSTGNYDWGHGSDSFDNVSPWKMEVGPDDRLYVGDAFVEQGLIFSFDQLISSNSLRAVLRDDNYSSNNNVFIDGFTLSGSAAAPKLWVADSGLQGGGPQSSGIRLWNLNGAGLADTNDQGVVTVTAGAPGGLNAFPVDVSLDGSSNIYAVQQIQVADAEPRILKFPAYSGTTLTNDTWSTNAGYNGTVNGRAVSVDPSGTYVAAAFQGDQNAGDGSVEVYYASNGVPVASVLTNGSFFDVAWDNAGNLYSGDDFTGYWRMVSPPGSNSATTVAVATIQIGSLTPPTLSNPVYQATQVQLTINGDANATYVIQAATSLSTPTWTPVLTNTAPTATRVVTVPASGSQSFYRAKVGP